MLLASMLLLLLGCTMAALEAVVIQDENGVGIEDASAQIKTIFPGGSPLANAFPSGFASTCLLLTDGTVICHEYNTNRWHRLKPDINGSYQNGSWDVPGFTVADMPNANDPTIGCVNCPYQPLDFASAVLPDGRVVVIGGEYNNLVPL
ncbi:MAG: hypothetical protein DMG86_20740 [Acidobacteria bacterium]|nr:MAG: hypothetical protein DMG86_20740 [Acidobacteriota bacterium]